MTGKQPPANLIEKTYQSGGFRARDPPKETVDAKIIGVLTLSGENPISHQNMDGWMRGLFRLSGGGIAEGRFRDADLEKIQHSGALIQIPKEGRWNTV